MFIDIYAQNGLVFWTEKEISLRERFRDFFASEMRAALLSTNPAWKIQQIEAPLLTPRDKINPNYTNEDVWIQDENDLVLRPETTPGSFTYLEWCFNNQREKPPICVWQAGKSFRKEQDQVSKNMRLKEFYQQEFQCVYTDDSGNDYFGQLLPFVERMIWEMVGLPTRIVESDRLPSYSLKTMDVEVNNGDKWMEVSSISLRKDFTAKAKFLTKNKGEVERSVLVVEVAIGLDRCVYNFQQRKR